MRCGRNVIFFVALAALASFSATVPAGAQTRPAQAQKTKPSFTITMATIAPKDTSPDLALQRMRDTWLKAPDSVDAVIYSGGLQGGEAETVNRIRIGQLQAALLTVTGLMEIDKSASALQNMPMMFRSLDEVEYVRDKLMPDLNRTFEQRGFVVLCWVDVGWVRFFSKDPLIHPADLKKMKVFTWAGDSRQADLMRAAGYQPVELETADIRSSLESGRIGVVPSPPEVAMASQFDGPARHMLDLNWAPLVGGLVVSKKTWDSIPRTTQDVLRQAAQEAGKEITLKGRAESDRSVQLMVERRHLTVHHVTPEIETEWEKVAADVYKQIRGGIVPADLFDKVQAILLERRAAKPESQVKK